MGSCINVSAQDGAILSAGNNGIAVVGGNCQGHVVLDSTLYRPPVEFHIDLNGQTITDTNPSRQLALAVQLTGPTIPTLGYTGAKPNGLPPRPPLVLVHGINSDPTFWGMASWSSTGGSFPSIGPISPGTWADQFTKWGFVCTAADHSAIPSAQYHGNGDIHDSYGAVKSATTAACSAFRTGSLGTSAIASRCRRWMLRRIATADSLALVHGTEPPRLCTRRTSVNW